MDFDEAERRFYELKGRLDTGRITPQDYQAALRELKVVTPEGRTWMIGGQTGRWYHFVGGSWVQGEPRRPAPPPQGADISRPNHCARCGQPVAAGQTLCDRCDKSLGAPTVAPPQPPPVAARAPVAEPRPQGGGSGRWVIGGFVGILALAACFGLAAAAFLWPGSPLAGVLPFLAFAATPTPAAAPPVPTVALPVPTATPSAAVPTVAVAPPKATASPSLTPAATVTPTTAPTATPVATATATATAAPPSPSPAPSTATRSPTPAAPPATGRILYTVYDAASRTDTIYVINADGSGAAPLIGQGIAPSWAPDGRIVFHSVKNDQLGLVIRHPDGTLRYPKNYEVLHEDEMPFWSPDASRIVLAFGANSGDKPWRLVVMNADGTGRHDLAGFNGRNPAWSPGNLLAFRRVYSQEGLYVVSAEGGTPRLLANVGNDTAPAWSPDGGNVAFVVDKDSKGDWDIYVVNVDGSGLKNLTSSPGVVDVLPAWLPGGKHIAFRSNRGGAWGLWVMSSDGTGAVRIADAPLDTSRYLEDRMSAK